MFRGGDAALLANFAACCTASAVDARDLAIAALHATTSLRLLQVHRVDWRGVLVGAVRTSGSPRYIWLAPPSTNSSMPVT
jgi:hypothetical protein